MLHILRHLQREAVIAAVLMAFHIRMPHDVVVQKDMLITDIRLLSKTGGVHGSYFREE